MRSIKELLQLMLDSKYLFKLGLCTWNYYLWDNNLINNKEYFLINKYIRRNRPSKWSGIKAFINRNSDWYWSIGDIEPRIKWLKKHIKLNS